MNYTIDTQLTRLLNVKNAIKEAINEADPNHLLTSNSFEDFAEHIRTYLGPKTTPVTRYTVTFNANGSTGTIPSAQTVTSGTVITLPSYVGTKSGYNQISGWATSNSATSATYNFGSSYTVTRNITLYAVFQAEVAPTTEYTITFDANGSTPDSGSRIPDQIVAESGTTIMLPSYSGTKEHYTQEIGWSTRNDVEIADYQPNSEYVVQADTTLYAVFKINQHKVNWIEPESGTITASVNGNTITNGVTNVSYGSTVTLHYSAPNGYVIDSLTWNRGNLDSISSTTSETTTFTMIDNDVINISIEVELTRMVTITVASNNTSWGTVSGGGTYAVGSTQTIQATPNQNYHFVSWNDGDTTATRQITVPNSNTTYTATFAVNVNNVNCIEYVCTEPDDSTGTPCYSSIAQNEFETYYKSNTIAHAFDVSRMKLLHEDAVGEYDFGELRSISYPVNLNGVNVSDSYSMYWIAVPSGNTIKEFWVNYGESVGEEDLIDTNSFNTISTHKKFENVTLNDNNTYTIYGIWENGKTNKIHLVFE